MAKKRKAESDDDAYTDSEASFEPKKRKRVVGKKPAKRQKTSLKSSGRKRDLSDAEYMDEPETADSPETLQTRPHPISLHVISNAAPLREVLLHWYGGVHESRGMPWRKPYVHSWDVEQKAQRAYEVCLSIQTSVLNFGADVQCVPLGMGVRDHATANPGSHRDTILQQMDGEVSRSHSFIRYVLHGQLVRCRFPTIADLVSALP